MKSYASYVRREQSHITAFSCFSSGTAVAPLCTTTPIWVTHGNDAACNYTTTNQLINQKKITLTSTKKRKWVALHTMLLLLCIDTHQPIRMSWDTAVRLPQQREPTFNCVKKCIYLFAARTSGLTSCRGSSPGFLGSLSSTGWWSPTLTTKSSAGVGRYDRLQQRLLLKGFFWTFARVSSSPLPPGERLSLGCIGHVWRGIQKGHAVVKCRWLAGCVTRISLVELLHVLLALLIGQIQDALRQMTNCLCFILYLRWFLPQCI